MPPNLNRLTTISRQPSLRDYEPHRHKVSLSSILDSHSPDASNALQSSSMQGGTNFEGSFRILLYDTPSHKVKELVFSAEEDFDSNILDILEPHKRQAQDVSSSPEKSADEAKNAHDSDPLLCEAVLRCVYAQGNSEFSVQERQDLAENVKRSFLLSESAFHEAKNRAVKATRYRQAEVQAHLKDLQQDKGWSLNPQQFESSSFYEESKLHEIKELSRIEASLQTLPSFSAQVQVSILSAEDSSADSNCIKRRSCYGWSEESQVYCTLKVIPGGQILNDEDDNSPDHITKEAAYTGCVEWNDKSPWILVSSVQDRLYIKMWRKKMPTRLSKGSKEFELSLLRNISQRKKKITWNGDTFLGQIILPMNQIETRALSSRSIRGSFPSKSYSLSNARDEKLMTTLELQIAFYCELLLNDPAPVKKLLMPPLADVEAGYDALVHVAYGMHLEEELELEATWQNILSCYESYYRLRRETCCLVVLKHMATLFQPNLEYLRIMARELQPICKFAKDGKLSRSEYSLLAQTIALMIKPSIDAIEDFQSIFALNQPKGAVSKLIELLSLLLCWDPNPKEANACIKRWVKVSCVQRFNKHLTENSSEGEITSRTFSIAISLLQKDLRTLYTCFKDEFPEELGLFQTCAFEYYLLVSQYIIGIVGSVKISSTDFEDLTRELSLLHQELERSKMKMDLLDLHGLLRDHILELIAAVKPRMIDWIISSLSDEKWEPISPQTDAFFSFSVVDLYFMINGVVENLTTRLSYFPFGKLYYFNLEESICSAVETYLQIIEKLCLQELPDRFNEEQHHFLTHFKSIQSAKSVCISKTLCVKLNNLHAVLQQQMTLEATLTKRWENYVQTSSDHPETEDLQNALQINGRAVEKINVEDPVGEKRVGQLFEKLHGLVKRSLSNVTGLIVESMQNELTKRLQKLMEMCSSTGGRKFLVMEDLELLTTYLDDHLKVLNEWLSPEVFRFLLLEIAGALLFCMEEFALNRDEDPNPMTSQQRDWLEQTLNLFYNYFYGDGVGVSKSEMDRISGRLRKILQCSDLHTHELCALYWRAWDRFNEETVVSPSFCTRSEEVHLHVLDFLLLLQQRDDDEARIVVTNQKLLAKNKMMQFIFGLPKDEKMVASFTCRNSGKRLGTLFITAKHVSFADASMLVPDNRRIFILPLERLRQVNLVGFDSISLVTNHSNPEQFSRFTNRDAVLQAIYNQVRNTGTFLEMYMAPIWGQVVGESVGADATSLKRFKCSRQGLISKHQGSLIISAACLIFEPEKKKKRIFLEHGAISKVHAERKGLRASGVVIEMKTGNSLEFVDFDMNLPLKDIAKEIEKLVIGGRSSGD